MSSGLAVMEFLKYYVRKLDKKLVCLFAVVTLQRGDQTIDAGTMKISFVISTNV